MAAKQSSGVIAIRSKKMFITPPGVLGYRPNLLEPDADAVERFGGALKFNLRVAYNEAQQARLKVLIQQFCVEALWGQLMDAVAEAKKAAPRNGWDKPDAEAWVDDHLRAPAEKAKVQEPTIQWSNEAEFKDKKGQVQMKTMKAYDANNGLLDLAELGLAGGSIVQPILLPGLYISPLMNKGQPDISFKLQGVRVLKLERYAPGHADLGDVDEEDTSLLGSDFEMDDLGSYAAQSKGSAPKASAGGGDGFSEEELPF